MQGVWDLDGARRKKGRILKSKEGLEEEKKFRRYV